MNKKNILIIHNHYKEQGGEDAVFNRQITEFKKQGYNVNELLIKGKKGVSPLRSERYRKPRLSTSWSIFSVHLQFGQAEDMGRPPIVFSYSENAWRKSA